VGGFSTTGDATSNLKLALRCASLAVGGHAIPDSSLRERRRCLAAHNRRGLVNQCIVLDCRDHEQRKIHTAREVALENRVTDVPAPHRKTLALAFFEVASAYDGPARATGKHPPARFHLVVEIREAGEARETAKDGDERLEPPGVEVLAIAGNM